MQMNGVTKNVGCTEMSQADPGIFQGGGSGHIDLDM